MLLKKNIPLKYILGKIKWEFSFLVVYATAIGILDERMHFSNMEVSTGVPMILGTIISLLLAFRSNQAYDRWWEARIVWGSIVNDSRSLTRLIISLTNDNTFPKGKFINRQIAWCHSLGDTLRNMPPEKKTINFLSKDELEFALKHDNFSNSLLQLHSLDIKNAYEKGDLNPYQQIELEKTINRLCDSMGKCERIKNTVFPTTYSLYIQFTLWLFILLFPFALTNYFGLYEIPLMIAISSALLLIEKMATVLQDPFENMPTDIPVSSLATTIERNLRQMMKDNTITSKVENESFYLM